MRLRSVLLGVAPALALAALLAAAAPVCADTGHGFAFADFSGVSDLALDGNAAQFGTVLRLTGADNDLRGAAWFGTQQPVAGGFTTTFTFRITDLSAPLNADGIAFVIQNAEAGTAAMCWTTRTTVPSVLFERCSISPMGQFLRRSWRRRKALRWRCQPRCAPSR